MKKCIFWSGALLAVCLAACSDDLNVQDNMPVPGEKVAFGIKASDTETSKSRTIYGIGQQNDGFDLGSMKQYNTLTISWKVGDSVRVYCPQAEDGKKWADYKVSTNPDDVNSSFFLAENEGADNGIRFGNTAEDHYFYAFYPTSTGATVHNLVTGLQNSAQITARIPSLQERGEVVANYGNQLKDIGNGVKLPANWKVIRPDMSYALMAGGGTWKPASHSKEVTLNFKPIVTTVEVLINGPSGNSAPDSLAVHSVSLRSDSEPIVGEFSATVTENGTVNGFALTNQNEDNTLVTINCEDTNGNPIYVKKNGVLSLKFFLLPKAIDYTQLSMIVRMDNSRVLIKKLSSTPGGSQIPEGGKIPQGSIARIWTPDLVSPAHSNWMSALPDNVLFSQLSLPGSVNSFTNAVYKESVGVDASTMMQCYQSIPPITASGNVLSQFDQGVRVFHMQIYYENGTGAIYSAGSQATSIVLKDVLNALKDKIWAAGNKEACVIFLDYVESSLKSAREWASVIESAVASWDDGTKIGHIDVQNTTLKDMRGKIAIFFKSPESFWTYDWAQQKYNYIQVGSGSLSDKMKLQTFQFFNGNSGNMIRAQDLTQLNNPSITSSSAAGNYAYRDGAGLVPYMATELVGANSYSTDTYKLIEIKKSLMKNLLNEVFAANNTKTNTLYLNDLSGFCAVKNENSTGFTQGQIYIHNGSSWTPTYSPYSLYDYNKWNTIGPSGTQLSKVVFSKPTGQPQYANEKRVYIDKQYAGRNKADGGNTVLCAQNINPVAFSDLVSMSQRRRVPLGFVMMNFAGTDEVKFGTTKYQVAGKKLVNAVVTNNFMFTLKTKKTTTTSISSRVSEFSPSSSSADGWDNVK